MEIKDITIEYLTEENFEKVRLLNREDISEAFVDTVDTLMEITQYGIDHHCIGHTYAVKYGEEYIGVVLLGEAIPWETDPEEMKEQPFYRLMGFVIDKRFRGKGIGAYVLETVISDGYREFGVRPIALGCHKDNNNAARFYEKHGFRKTNVMEGNDYYYLRYPEIVDEKAHLIREIYMLFRRALPYIVRDEETVLMILGNRDNKFIEKRTEKNQLVGVSVIHKNTILLLCVDEKYRNQGIGSQLLKQSEEVIKDAGYNEVVVGVGDDYLAPGVPTSKRYVLAENERLSDGVNEVASSFFEKRGYRHSWDCNCFDMKFPLSEFDKNEHSIGDIIEGIQYRFATTEDLAGIMECTNAACEEFTKYYQDEFLYTENDSSRVLIATNGTRVAGTLIVDMDERSGLGSVGCTTVHPDFQGKHIAVNMVILGTKYLKDVGMKEAYLSYTYSGLDHMYGYAGYKIFVYFMMARKKL